MRGKTLTIVFIVAILLIGGFFMLRGKNKKSAENQGDGIVEQPAAPIANQGQNQEQQSQDTSVGPGQNIISQARTAEEGTVSYTDAGFSPKNIGVKKGGTVTFVNNSVADFWPATNLHPTHILYTGSDIKKCFSKIVTEEEKAKMFDACGKIAPGKSWSFTPAYAGEWAYHDHLKPQNGGAILVLD